MATFDIWIQLENHAWDTCPNGVDRMTSEMFSPVNLPLLSPETGVSQSRPMFRPLNGDALIYRRYTANWHTPIDRKVNPWDLNEPDPTDNGTMGTIPGPVIECNVGATAVGDTVRVHFRNKDHRTITVNHPAVTHQVSHPAITHQVLSTVWVKQKILWFYIWIPTMVMTTVVDTPAWIETVVDKPAFTTQDDIPIEKRLHSIHPHGVVFSPQHDGAYPLSPPDQAQPLSATPGEANAWSQVPGFTGNFKQGDRVPPGGTFTYLWHTFGWPTTAGVWLYHDHSICDAENVELGAIGIIVVHNQNDATQDVDIRLASDPTKLDPAFLPHHLPGNPAGSLLGSPIDRSNPAFPLYRIPSKALYLQLFHALNGAPVCINGRTYLGNTPTMVAGTSTMMRFGVVGMGSEFHTFHIHGHRWILPGPHGATPGDIQASTLDTPISQFEDTRTFGPANSFVFTINGAGLSTITPPSFMRAGGPITSDSLGEWHMHCHVLMHMMTGMMGSLLIVNNAQAVTALPMGRPCPPDSGGGVTIGDDFFSPANVMIAVGQTVVWTNTGQPHTVTSNPGPAGCTPASSEAFNSPVLNNGNMFQHTFNMAGTFPYHCEIHGCMMAGTVTVM